MFSNRFWAKAILSLVLTGTFTILTACGSPAFPVADAASKAPAAAKTTAPAKTPAAKPTDKAAPKPVPPAPADKPAAKKGTQLLANPNFKEWDKTAPHRWTAEPSDKVVKTAGSGPNSVYVELKPSGTDKHTTLRQRMSGNLAGKNLTVTLRANAQEDKVLSAKLTYETKAGTQTLVLDAPGDGSWKSVVKNAVIPADAKAGSGMVTVVLRSNAKKSAVVDYVMVEAK